MRARSLGAVLVVVGCSSGGSFENGVVVAPLSPCVQDELSVAECTLVNEDGGCFVTGIGHIGDADNHPGAGRADQDSFGGNAKGMKDGTVQGQWQNTTHTGHLFHGQADWLRCWKDDGTGPDVPRAIPNNAEWGGPGTWDHEEGYSFRVHAQDRNEPGRHHDYYSIQVMDASGAVIYEEGDIIDGGNFQIHPPNNGHPYESDQPLGLPESDPQGDNAGSTLPL